MARRGGTARAATAAALTAAVAAVALLMFGSGGDYRVAVVVQNAGQLVEGNEVKVGGVPVGLVENVELTRDGRARLELSISDDELAPLHAGTTATVRAASLSGIANRYVALAPGPNSAAEIDDGGELRADDARAAVDLDQVLNSLDAAARDDIAAGTRLGARALDPAARELNAGLEALEPALAQSGATAAELRRDERELERLVVAAADVASALASRPAELEEVVPRTLAAVEQLARERRALDSTLARLPATLATANSTLVNVRALARDLRPAVRALGPSTGPLAELLPKVTRVGRAARPEVRAVRRVLDAPGGEDLLGFVRGLPELDRRSEPAVESLLAISPDVLRIVRDLRPYTPEIVAGQLYGFGGATTSFYDANGHYGRISPHGAAHAFVPETTLVPLGDITARLGSYRTRINRRCPGAATQPAPDGSNPFLDGRDDFPCDLDHTPR